MGISEAEAFDALVNGGNMKTWKKINTSNAGGSSWEPEKGDSLIGVFTGKRLVDTKYGQREIYNIQKEDQTIVDVWETAQLKRAFSQIAIGTELRITFNGKVLPDKGNAYKDYTVEV